MRLPNTLDYLRYKLFHAFLPFFAQINTENQNKQQKEYTYKAVCTFNAVPHPLFVCVA